MRYVVCKTNEYNNQKHMRIIIGKYNLKTITICSVITVHFLFNSPFSFNAAQSRLPCVWLVRVRDQSVLILAQDLRWIVANCTVWKRSVSSLQSTLIKRTFLDRADAWVLVRRIEHGTNKHPCGKEITSKDSNERTLRGNVQREHWPACGEILTY